MDDMFQRKSSTSRWAHPKWMEKGRVLSTLSSKSTFSKEILRTRAQDSVLCSSHLAEFIITRGSSWILCNTSFHVTYSSLDVSTLWINCTPNFSQEINKEIAALYHQQVIIFMMPFCKDERLSRATERSRKKLTHWQPTKRIAQIVHMKKAVKMFFYSHQKNTVSCTPLERLFQGGGGV